MPVRRHIHFDAVCTTSDVLRQLGSRFNGEIAKPLVDVSGGDLSMLQASMLDGLAYDVGPFTRHAGGLAEVGVRRGHVAPAVVVAGVVVVLDEDADLAPSSPGRD
jgi:hypothetical protein